MAVITGNSSNNVLRSNVEADRIDGGAGFDTVDYSASASAINKSTAARWSALNFDTPATFWAASMKVSE